VLSEPKQMQRAVEAFVAEIAPALRDVVLRLPEIADKDMDRDVATEAFNLTTALIDVDRSHTDDELWGLIFAFGRWLPDQLARAKPDDLRRTDLLNGREAWLEQVSPMFQILVTADRRFGTSHSRTYYDRALNLAFTVAALEAAPSREELQAIDRFRNHMLVEMSGLPSSPLAPRSGPPATGIPEQPGASGSAPAPGQVAVAGAPVEPVAEVPLPPARPIEELLAELDDLVGLDSVKTEVRLVTNLLRVQQLRAERKLPTTPQSRHLVFTGTRAPARPRWPACWPRSTGRSASSRRASWSRPIAPGSCPASSVRPR
jgi:hypothetical protein